LNELIENSVQSTNHANRRERKRTDAGQLTTDYGRVTTNNWPPTTGQDEDSSEIIPCHVGFGYSRLEGAPAAVDQL